MYEGKMEPTSNLKTGGAYKELLLKKLTYAFSCSFLFQMALLFCYICVVNFSTDVPVWIQSVFNLLTSIKIWLQSLPFVLCYLIQIVTLGKEYVMKASYHRSRFQKFLSVLSFRNIFLVFLHLIGSTLSVILFLSLVEGNNEAIYVDCDDKICLQEGAFFLILNGLWVGLYYFLHDRARCGLLYFPVIRRSRFFHFKSEFVNILNRSKNVALYPVLYFIIFYLIFHQYLCGWFTSVFYMPIQIQEFSLYLYIFAWIFTTIYIININFIQFFFETFLTEPFEHAIVKMYNSEASLDEALLLENIPVIQHLACLDFYLLSIWSPQRRKMLYTLSQPGGHPHTWNRLIGNVLKLTNDFLKSTDSLLENMVTAQKENVSTIGSEFHLPTLDPVINRNSVPCLDKYANMRRMSSESFLDSPQIIEVQQRSLTFFELVSFFSKDLLEKIVNICNYIKTFKIFKYLFGNLSEMQIQECFQSGQSIVWIIQGLANIVVKSFYEDPYGVVQKDLPVILTNLVELKISMEKLIKILQASKKSSNENDFTFRMGNNLDNATKRSLINLCRIFGSYLNDIPLDRNILAHLQHFL